MEGEQLLLAEYKRFAESFWKNEEIGEKRVTFIITLVTAILTALVSLLTSQHKDLQAYRQTIAIGVLAGLFVLGLVTLLRMLQRDRVTNEYKNCMDYIRERFRHAVPDLAEYELPFQRSWIWWARGGLAEMVAAINALVIACLVAVRCWSDSAWGMVLGAFVLVFAAQGGLITLSKWKREPRSQRFRGGAGAVILDGNGKVLALKRIGIRDGWQLPQGGLNVGEKPYAAVIREIREETGIKASDLKLLSNECYLSVYELPPEYRSEKTGRGQVHYWFVFCFMGDENAISLEPKNGRCTILRRLLRCLGVAPIKKEFQDWKWIRLEDLLAEAVGFRQPVYQGLAKHFARYLSGAGQ